MPSFVQACVLRGAEAQLGRLQLTCAFLNLILVHIFVQACVLRGAEAQLGRLQLTCAFLNLNTYAHFCAGVSPEGC